MAGTAVTPSSPAPGAALSSVGARNNDLNASELNSFRISAVIDHLSLHLGRHVSHDLLEFLNLCLSLARDIDFAIANNEVPGRFRDLPPVIKQVCGSRNEPHQQAAIMVLMISVKNACQSGWFSDTDSEDLRKLTMEIASNFGSMSNLYTERSCSHPVVSTIVSRYLPRMKMGHTFAFLEVKPGFEAYVSDLQISKNHSPGEKIRLFVLQTDNIETSSCLISPPKVNFLLNGKGVEKRTIAYMDPAPQIPTVVTPLLKYGSNLLQAVGEFNGNYIIAVAFTSEMPIPDKNVLQDYEQQAPATVDPDSEIIEGPSRISLNCPLSFKRIKTPIKGHLCKHIQCFDFDNYMNMNSRRPQWRCPHCNQHVCFTDIRIDRQMVKVLEEVGLDVSDIIFSSDGSWKAVTASSDATQKPEDKVSEPCWDKSPQTDDILDLTLTEDAMDIVSTHEAVDTELNPNSHQSSNPPEEDSWAAILMSTFEAPNVQANTQIVPPTASFTSPSGEVEAFHSTVPQNETSLQNTLLQQYQFGSPPVTNEYGRFPNFPTNVTRTPTAVQALPVQSPTSVPQHSFRNSGNNFIPIGIPASQAPSPAPNISGSASRVSNFGPNGVSSTAAPHIANSLPRVNPRSVPTSQMSSSPLYQHSGVQQQNRPFTSVQLPQQNAGLRAPNQVPGSMRVPSSSHQTTNNWVSRVSTVPAQSSGNFAHPQNHIGTSQNRTAPGVQVSSSQRAHLVAAANQTIQMAIDPLRTARPSYSMNPGEEQRGNIGVTSPPPVMGTDGCDPSDVNWRPAARMRGALSGQAYADAFNQFIIRPNQQAQAARPQLQALVADRVGLGSPATPNYPSAGPPIRPGGTEALPNGSPRQQ